MNLLNEEQNYLKMDEPTANKSPSSYRPVPKPRKSLMANAAAAVASASSAAAQQAAAIIAAQSIPSKPPADSSTKGRRFHSSPSPQLYDNKTPPPPPLPPRTPFSISPLAVQQQHYRPFPPPNSSLPEKIDFSTSKIEQRQQILADNAASAAENNTNRNGLLNKIYPTLDDLLGQQKLAAEMASSSSTTTKVHSLTMLNNKNSIPIDTASNNSSDFSSDDYHSVADSPAATFGAATNGNTNCTTATTFAAYPSFYEAFGDVKSDGESVCFSGWVQMAPQGGLIKHRKRGFAMIRQGQFFITPDEETDLPFFGPADLCKCVYLGKNLAGNRTEIMLIFRDYNAHGKLQKSTAAMTAANSHHQPQNGDEALQCVLRFTPEENGDYWLPLLAKQCCSPRNELLDDCLSLDCFGRLWIKQGVSGIWNEGCAFASKRILHFWLEGPPAQLAQIDIRKIILIKRKDIPSSDWCNRIEHSGQGPILIALEGSSLYLQAQNDQCTANWLEFLNSELRVEPNTLEECRLTGDDVPVIVDKCIRLISTYGLYQQGIYRKSGSAAESKRLMAAFREDPYAVHLKSPITDETIFAVAGVLRTFFRQLNSPLIPVRMHGKLYEISNISLADKPRQYQALICSLPKVYFKTLRKLLGHLQEIISHESRNFASLDNISKIFGPTLFNESNTDEEVSVEWYTMATKQTLVMRDLIFHYCDIFGVSADELLAKCKLDVIQEQKSSKNPATGMLVPIHLFEKDHKCFNIQSEWTAGQVVAFKLDKLAFISAAVESYALFEVVRNGQLERRIGANETLRSIVLGRWLDWEEHQNNILLLKKDLHPFQPQTGRAFADDLKIAEPGSKSFKSASLRIEEGTRVCQYSKTLKRQNEWKVDEMLWFMGAELDRKCPFPFALTFFLVGGGNGGNEEKRKWGTTMTGTSANSVAKCRGKLPGFCVAFRDEVQRHQWMNCICLNQSEYLPQPLIQI